jgi:hypothetical protein
MNSHYCRVGTVTPSIKKELISKASEYNSVKPETKEAPSSGKQLSR